MVKEAENEFKNLKVNLAVEDRINKFMTGLSNFRTQIDSHKNYLRSKISYEDPLENGKIINYSELHNQLISPFRAW